MINILTVHWKTPKWIPIQKSLLSKNIKEPFLYYGFLTDIDYSWESSFDICLNMEIEDHAAKLDILAKLASFNRKTPDDVLLFLDGDSFPLFEMSRILDKLCEVPLIAIKRSELHGDPQPHPSFCLTIMSFWDKIGGTWKVGGLWNDQINQELVADVGGALFVLLKKNNIRWFPLERTNQHALHSLWYAVYGGIIYHHGAGFRFPFSRIDLPQLPLHYTLWRRFNHFLNTLAAFSTQRWERLAARKRVMVKKDHEIIFNLLKEGCWSEFLDKINIHEPKKASK